MSKLMLYPTPDILFANRALENLHIGENGIPIKNTNEIIAIVEAKPAMKILCAVPFRDKITTNLDETVATMVEANAGTGSPLPDVSQIPEDVKLKMAGKRVLMKVTPRRFVSWDHGKLPSNKTPDGLKKAAR